MNESQEIRRFDMHGEMYRAALLAEGVTGDPEVAKAEDALVIATINDARAPRLDGSIGSLVVGKCAAMVCLNLAAPTMRDWMVGMSETRIPGLLFQSIARENKSGTTAVL